MQLEQVQHFLLLLLLSSTNDGYTILALSQAPHLPRRGRKGGRADEEATLSKYSMGNSKCSTSSSSTTSSLSAPASRAASLKVRAATASWGRVRRGVEAGGG